MSGAVQINTLIPKDLKRSLDRYCFENEAKQKEVVEAALRRFLADKIKN